MRLLPDQSTLIRRSPEIRFTFDGRAIAGHVGESVAAALWRAGLLGLRQAPDGGGPRGMFCCMGVCQECLVQHDGQNVESCRLIVSEGLVLNRAGQTS